MPRQTIGGRYELEQPLGTGAMSSVWLAHDRELERSVAAKLLAPDADRARFEREAHAVAALAHPNICQLYDYGEAEQGPYMILEHMSGGTLEDRLAAGGPLPDDETMQIAREVAAGLAHAHERGLVHRDLKPANILFDSEGRAKIADFGIARIEGGNQLTAAGTVLGTAAYLSPEQASGESATPASDVYSFGVILFRMLTGKPPFRADNAIALVQMHQTEPAPLVEETRPGAPPVLAALAQAALEKDQAARPADGSALVAALAGTAGSGAPSAGAATQILAATPADDGGRTQVISRRPPRRRRVLPLVVVAALAIGAVGAAAAFMLTSSGGDSGAPAGADVPSLTLPTVGRQGTLARTTSASTATTTAASSTSSTTSTQPVTTATPPSTTRGVTTVPTPVLTTTPAPLPPPATAPAVTTATPPPPPPPTTATATATPATTTVP